MRSIVFDDAESKDHGFSVPSGKQDELIQQYHTIVGFFLFVWDYASLKKHCKSFVKYRTRQKECGIGGGLHGLKVDVAKYMAYHNQILTSGVDGPRLSGRSCGCS